MTGTTTDLQLVDEERIPFRDHTAGDQTVSQLPPHTGTPNLGDYISIYCHGSGIRDDPIHECGVHNPNSDIRHAAEHAVEVENGQKAEEEHKEGDTEGQKESDKEGQKMGEKNSPFLWADEPDEAFRPGEVDEK